MTYEVYGKRSAWGKARKPARVTFTTHRLIVFSRAAMEWLNHPSAVLFLWDADKRCVGLKATGDGDPCGHPVSISGQRQFFASAGLFIDYIGLNNVGDLPRSFTATWDEAAEMLVLDLKVSGA